MKEQDIYERLTQLGHMQQTETVDTEFESLKEKHPEIWDRVIETAFCKLYDL